MERSRAIGLAAAITVVTSLLSPGVGFRMQAGNTGTFVAMALSPLLVLLWLAATATIVLSQLQPEQRATPKPAAWYRVLIALVVDFNLYLLAVFVPICAAALLVEGLHLGEFVWAFERDFGRPSDDIVLLTVVCSFPTLWAGLSLSFLGARSSPGCLAAGIVLTWTLPPAVWRSALFAPFAYFALAFPLFPFTLMARALGLKPVAFQRVG